MPFAMELRPMKKALVDLALGMSISVSLPATTIFTQISSAPVKSTPITQHQTKSRELLAYFHVWYASEAILSHPELSAFHNN